MNLTVRETEKYFNCNKKKYFNYFDEKQYLKIKHSFLTSFYLPIKNGKIRCLITLK